MSVTTEASIHAWAAYDPISPLKPFAYIPRPLLPDDVEVSITHCGICYSDVHTYTGGWGETRYPLVVGHEIVGKVTAVGPKVTDVKVGDRVGVGPQRSSCLQCHSCQNSWDQHCAQRVFTYNDVYKDEIGGVAHGGYAERIRVRSAFAHPIPEVISSVEAASLLCAGITTYTPLKKLGVGPGSHVGVVGIGGLGHLALQFARALGAEVTAISRGDRKKMDAMKLGATHYVDSTNVKQMKAAAKSLDVLMCTAWGKGMSWDEMLSLVKERGSFILLSVPEEKISFSPGLIVMREIKFTGSLLGSRAEMKEMLELAAKAGVRPLVETMPMEQVNEALEKVKTGQVRYRMVLTNPTVSTGRL